MERQTLRTPAPTRRYPEELEAGAARPSAAADGYSGRRSGGTSWRCGRSTGPSAIRDDLACLPLPAHLRYGRLAVVTPGVVPVLALAREQQVGSWLRSRVSWGEKDTREARRAVAQLVEDGGADEAPESVSRDFVEEDAQPPAIKAEVYEPCGDVDEV
jgi:hypothetical protein